MENITPPGTPAKRTLAVLDNPTPAPSGTEAAPPTRISSKVKAAIDAMVSGDCKNITAAAEKGRARARESEPCPEQAAHRRVHTTEGHPFAGNGISKSRRREAGAAR
jgi:hypothetical protein